MGLDLLRSDVMSLVYYESMSAVSRREYDPLAEHKQ